MDYMKINNYIEMLYGNKDSLNRSMFIEMTNLKDFIPVIDDDVARMLRLLILINKPKHVLEIGTSIGYSTTAMAMIVKEYGGRITTIEYDARVAAKAKENFIKAGVDDVIDIIIGDARDILPSLECSYDMIFQDVDKRLYSLLYDDCIKLLTSGGMLLAEDTLFPVIDLDIKWHNLIKPIEEFNLLAVSDDRLESTLLPIGDGLLVSVKK